MCHILFCDWNIDSGNYDRNSLFDLTDFSDYDIVFFDPLTFAAKNRLRKNYTDLHRAEYFDFSYDKFVQFLSKTKLVSEMIHDFLFGGGILVIRSTIPMSYIKVSKNSSAGISINRYTESILPLFFWMEEFLGKFFCQKELEHSCQFLAPGTHLYRTFGRTPIESSSAIVLNSKENQTVIAEGSTYPHNPQIYQIMQSYGPGVVYVIPDFLHPNETNELANAFGSILAHRRNRQQCPPWVDKYEKKLITLNPYHRQIRQYQDDIRKMERCIKTAENDSLLIENFIDLLFTTGDELKIAVESAFKFIGFQFPKVPATIVPAEFQIYMRDETAANIVIEVFAEELSSINYKSFDYAVHKIEKCQRDDKPKCIFIGNAPYETFPTERKNTFEEKIIETNQSHHFCLLSTVDLFNIAVSIMENSESPRLESIKEMIRKDIVSTDGMFSSNPRKYLAASTV